MFEKMNNMKSWILLHTSWGKLMSLAIGFSVIVFLLSTALSMAVSHELYFFAVFIALPIYMLANRIGIREEREATKKIIRQELDNNYRQIESLLAIHFLIKFEAACPVLRGWPISPDFAYLAIKNILNIANEKPDFVILECGSGSSTIVFGTLLKQLGKGRIISLDSDSAWYKETLNNLKTHNLVDYVELIYAPLKRVIISNHSYIWYETENLPKEAKIDFLIVDGPPGDVCVLARFPSVPLLKDHLNQDCVILVDDAKRDDEKLMIRAWEEVNLVRNVQIFDTETGAAIMNFSKI